MVKNFFKYSSWTVGSKLTLHISLFFTITLFLFIGVINHNIRDASEKIAISDVAAKTNLIVDMLNLFDTDLRNQTDDEMKVFKGEFPEGF